LLSQVNHLRFAKLLVQKTVVAPPAANVLGPLVGFVEIPKQLDFATVGPVLAVTKYLPESVPLAFPDLLVASFVDEKVDLLKAGRDISKRN